VIVAWLVGWAAAQDLRDLALGAADGFQVDGAPLEFRFVANEPGILTVVTRSEDHADLVIEVTDVDGQGLPDGRSDQDLQGQRTDEHVAANLPWAGEYRVRVFELNRAPATFHLGATWLRFPTIARREPDHGRPGTARVLTAGARADLTLRTDTTSSFVWLRFDPTEDGWLSLRVRAPDGDLVLESYLPGAFGHTDEESDQDLEGVLGNESLTVGVRAGQPSWFRVRDRGDHSGPLAFHVEASFSRH
jgi:hypothetical protein